MGEKKAFDYVVVILVYRNIKDLDECITSIKQNMLNTKIIVVNAYYDEESENAVRHISEKNNCDFISLENKGYGYGNNAGIEFAISHYDFKYVIVSNPDIVVKSFPQEINLQQGDIIAPQIIAATGKKQNPLLPRRIKISERLIYGGFKKKRKLCFLLGVALNRISRESFLLRTKMFKKPYYLVYAAHGSFVMLSKYAIEQLGTRIYDENMFLFAEESVLALQAQRNRLKTLYIPEILISHKEDGSMKLGNVSVNDELKKANIYYYEKYVMKNEI